MSNMKSEELLENILREVEISNFFTVIFVGLILLVLLVALGTLNIIPSILVVLIGLVVLISFLIYLVDFVRVGKFRRLYNR